MLPAIHRELFADVLEQASNQISNNGCCDFDVTVTDENRAGLREFIGEYADDEDELTHLLDQLDEGRVYFVDFSIIDMLVKRLKENKL